MYAIRSYYELLNQPGGVLISDQRGHEALDDAKVAGELARGRVVGDDRPQRSQRVGDATLVGKDLLRITSYNVCYTKLLRASESSGGQTTKSSV